MRENTLFFLSILFLLALPVAAQQPSVIGMTETMDIIPGDYRRPDLNGDLCAVVKVQVLDEITTVEGNVMGEIVNRGTEKWVYMSKGTKWMKIFFKNNLSIRIEFSDYKINELKSCRAYELVIDVPNKPVVSGTDDIPGNNLHFQLSPSNAIVHIWGETMSEQTHYPDADGSLKVYLPYGRYHYRIEANGYQEREDSVFVNDQEQSQNVTLSIIKGTLTLVCPSEKAEFYVNGQKVTKTKKATTWSGQMEPGTYTVEARRKGYATQTKQVDVAADYTTTVRFEQLTKGNKLVSSVPIPEPNPHHNDENEEEVHTHQIVEPPVSIPSVADNSINFYFVYIDHEPTTPVGELCKRLEKLHNDAVETGDKLIVYLANEEEPFVSFTNLYDHDPAKHRDNTNAFYNIIDELQRATYHEVSIGADNSNIRQLLAVDGSYPLFRENGNEGTLRYKSVSLNFYVGNHFWGLRGNEEVIADVFVSLNIPAYMERYSFLQLSFNVFVPEGERLSHSESAPFGRHNKGGINQIIRIKEYAQ